MPIDPTQAGFGDFLAVSHAFFLQTANQMRTALARRKVYRTTFDELSALTDRDLDDLEITRSAIERIALESANGV